MEADLNRLLLDTFENALERNFIQVYYQPVIRTITGQVCGFEALARWIHPERGLIQPQQFIGLLEDHRLIHRLDCCIVRQVCARLREIMDRGECVVPISVNLSRLDFELCDIFDEVDRCASEYRIPRNYLHIEITESLFSDMPKRIHTALDRFRKAGYQVWMDDFGSGFSSLNMLKDYTFDELKVDMGFMSCMNAQSRKVLTSVIDMAKNMGIHTLVEGVETEEMFRFLRDIGCEKLQGYLFGRPQPFEEIMAHLERNGIALEKPALRAYYDSIGDVNVLSAAPFMSREKRDKLSNVRELNSIPLALVEIRDFHFTMLYCNAAFENVLREMQWHSEDLDGILGGRRCPADNLPERIHAMLDEARKYGEAEVHFISDGEFFEAQAKCVADASERFCLLLRLQNLSHDQDRIRTGTLDAEMRHLYALFDTIAMIDIEQERYDLIYMGPNDIGAPSTAAREVFHAYSENIVFPEDRERFLRFYDLDTMEERLLQSGRNHLQDYYRARNRFGQYAWSKYILVYCRTGIVLSLIRWADEDVRDLRDRFPEKDHSMPDDPLTDGRLWKSLIQTDASRLYWKDRQRRFVGASKGFLDFLGLGSIEDIRGKTDEEIGWHIRAEHAVNDDLRTLGHGTVNKDHPLRFLVDGVNRNTLNSTAPVYDENGAVVGLVGSLTDYDPDADTAVSVPDLSRIDGLTGLLNARGISEELSVLCDMFYLRGIDFMRVHLSIEDYDSHVRQYGHLHGEKLIASVGRALKGRFGSSAVLGRSRGQQFVILRQFVKPEDLPRLTAEIHDFCSSLLLEDDMAGSVYLSTGICAFSECRDAFWQEQLTDQRLSEEHKSRLSDRFRLDFSSSFFRVYDNLPIAFAVYEIKVDPETDKVDAYCFYVNNRFAAEQNRTPKELIGRCLRDIFPTLEQEWYDIAYQAAFSSRETVVDNIWFESMNAHYSITASQIFRPGYCVFTYKPLDGPNAVMKNSDGMDYQRLVDQIDRPCAIVSVDRKDQTSVRIVCSNRPYKEVMPPPHRDGMLYSEHMPRNPRFEDFCYHSAVLGEAGHVYMESPRGWINQQALPIRTDDAERGYCLTSFELTENASSQRLATVSVDVAQFAVRSSLTLMSSEDFKAGVQSVLQESLAITGAHHSRIFLLDHRNRTFQIYSEAADELCLWRQTEFTYELLATWARCVGDKVAYLVTDSRDIDSIAQIAPEWAAILRSCEVQSLVLLPLRRGRELIGYVDFVDFDIRTAAQVRELAELITVFLAAEISNHQLMERLEEMSTTDSLTGLRNREAMQRRMEEMDKGCFGIVNLDLNGLKRVNDTMGHGAGDRLLVEAAEALKKIFYFQDIFRTGGDEFIVLLPGISRDSFERKLDRFRASMRKNTEISFACGAFWSDGSTDLPSAFRAADNAMYEDKKAYYRTNPDRKRL